MGQVDLSKIKYNVVAVLSGGGQVNLENVAENIAWEENEKELAVRLNITIRDVKNGGGRIAQQLALCTALVLYYDTGSGPQEAFRGTIWEWGHSQVNDDEIIITAYDMLFYLQKSEDYKYYEAGKSTKAIIGDILGSWSVPMGDYSGPSVTHEKVVYKSQAVSSMLTAALDEAVKKTGKKGIIRAKQGKCEIVKQGTNSEIWTFAATTNLLMASDKYSMTDLVTRVKIFGKEDKDGTKRPPVVAVENGATNYGTLQKVLMVGSSTVDEAKAEAASILSDKGKPKRTLTLRSPDMPCIRKGDRIRAILDNIDGYFFVLSVSHNATTMQMQMEVEPA